MTKVSVSILNAPKENAVSMFYNIETAKVDYFHIDVMDCKFVAINPETPVDCIKEFLPYIHQVLIMTVVPGKGGQKLISDTLDKIRNLKEHIRVKGLEHIDIEADGGINDKTAQDVRNAGCDILVSGSYITNSEDYIDSIKILRGIKI